jgi:sarcosine oxidase subunit alpha
MEWIRYHTRYDDWDFHLVNLTDAMGVINMAGPNARKVLAKVSRCGRFQPGLSLCRIPEFTDRGCIPVRAMRLGFVGELSYELHAPSSWMPALWDILERPAEEFGIANFGVEAQNVLRLEKGHVILGQESEQRTTLLDLGLGFCGTAPRPTAKTVGAVALRQSETDAGRLKLVGIQMEDNTRAPRDGVRSSWTIASAAMCALPEKARPPETAVGMALVDSPLAAIGTRLAIFEDDCNGNPSAATVVAMPFYDPEGQRMRM